MTTQQPQMYMVPHAGHNALGTASFVLGIMTAVLSFVPFGILIAMPTGLAGRGLGLGNLPRLNHHTASNKALTWIGIGLSLVGIVIGIVLTAAVWHGNATSGS